MDALYIQSRLPRKSASPDPNLRSIDLMRRHFHLMWILMIFLSIPVMAQQKKRVAILNFDYGTVQSAVAGIFGTNVDVGKGISDLLVQKLVQDGKYSVIERNALDKVLAEQNFSNSDRADSTTAAKIGRVLGVDAVIIGSITQFGRDDKNTSVGGAGVGHWTGKFGIGGVSKRDAKAVVGVTARVIDTTTAEILTAATGTGESTRSGTSLLGAGGGSGGAGGGAVDMSSKNFAGSSYGKVLKTITNKIGDATVTDVDEQSATATLAGSGPAKVGDMVKNSQ
jgi:curli biogenesis system outer membrane secretion channel CsgG